jgi:hypothetical protein
VNSLTRSSSTLGTNASTASSSNPTTKPSRLLRHPGSGCATGAALQSRRRRLATFRTAQCAHWSVYWTWNSAGGDQPSGDQNKTSHRASDEENKTKTLLSDWSTPSTHLTVEGVVHPRLLSLTLLFRNWFHAK